MPPMEHTESKFDALDIAEKSGDMSDEFLEQQHTQDLDLSKGNNTDETIGDDSEEDNEFLNSSSFLSNSQIIHSTNVASFKPAEQNLISSPIRRAKEPLKQQPREEEQEEEHQETTTSPITTKKKKHFKILMNKKSSTRLDTFDQSIFDNVEGSGDDDHDDKDTTSGSENHKQTKFIDIDDPRSTPKLPKMHPDTTPWRRLRPQSTIRIKDTDFPSLPTPDVNSIHYVQSLFDSNFDAIGTSSRSSPRTATRGSASLLDTGSMISEGGSKTTANMSYELENLRKQVTNYKLHQRVLMELIRNLVASTGMKTDDIKDGIMQNLERENEHLINERQTLQQELLNKQKEPHRIINNNAQDDQKYNDKIKEILDLKNDLIVSQNRCTELTSYIDELRNELLEQQQRQEQSERDVAKNHDNDTERWLQLLNELLSILLKMVKVDSAKAVQQARDSSRSMDTKLNVVKLALGEVLNNFEKTQSRVIQEQRNKENFANPGGLSMGVQTQFQDKMYNSKLVEQELRLLLRQQNELVSTLRSEYNSLQKQFKNNLQTTSNLKKMLDEKRANISELNDKVFELESQLGELEESMGSEHQEKEAKLLKNRLNVVKVNHSKEIEKLHEEIDNLQIQLEKLSRRSDDNKLMDDLQRKQVYINELNDEIAGLNSRLLTSNRDHEAEVVKIKSLLKDSREDFEGLVREYNTLQQDYKEIQEDRISKEKDYRRKLEHAAKELNLAVTKQRSLGAEKSKLTYALEESKRERNSLKLNNTTLNEKISRLTYEVSSLANYEVGFKSLFELQVRHIKNMLQDFEPLLEKSSYLQAQQKLDKLSDSLLDVEMTHSVIRSLLAFFENATGSLISDHKDLMMMNNNGGHDEDDQSEGLKIQIEDLKQQVQWYHDQEKGTNGKNEDDPDGDSPRTKLRIEDLQKKFKAERERRRVEFDQSQKLVLKLERENAELKAELERLRASQV